MRGKYPIHGWLNLYKPPGMTSNQAVGAVKRLLRPQKIGHAGTLDPLAEGVLPLALGEATKTVPYLMDAAKDYVFTVRWGEARSTDDAEGDVIETSDVRPSAVRIAAILPQFTGVIEQAPPVYSAIKIDGRRACDRARAGQEVVLKARQVEVFSLVLHPSPNLPPQGGGSEHSEQVGGDCATFTVTCSKGTYIRSLARDMAQALGTVGHVTYLKRARVGKFHERDAISLDFLEEFVHNAPAPEVIASAPFILPLALALDDIPALEVDEAAASRLRRGQFLPADAYHEGQDLAAYAQGRPVAIVTRQGGQLRPKRVFNLQVAG